MFVYSYSGFPIRDALARLSRLVARVPSFRAKRARTDDVANVVEHVETTLRVLLAMERREASEAYRAAILAEDTAAVREKRPADYAAALTAAERKLAAEWRLVWGDAPSVQAPRKNGAWADLRAALVARDMDRITGRDGIASETQLKAPILALLRVLPASARGLAGDLFVYTAEHP
jgi:hypothetical protein